MTAEATALTLLATAGAGTAVLHGVRLFRAGIAWFGLIFGGLWGWTLGGMVAGSSGGAVVGALVGAALLSAMATTAERLLASVLGGVGFWLLALGAGSAAGLSGQLLSLLGVAALFAGGALVLYLHDTVVAIAVAVWGTGFLRLGEIGLRAPTALPRDAWINAPELIVAGSYGRALADPHLRLLVLVGFVGVAYLLRRMEHLEARGAGGKLGPRRLRRLGWLCALLSLLPLASPALVAVGGAKFATWLHTPWHALGLSAATWPAATLVVWLLTGWARRSKAPARVAAALLGGLGLLAFGVLAQHVADGVPLEPLLQDALHPSGPLDPDVLTAAAFAGLLLLGPLSGRRSRGIG